MQDQLSTRAGLRDAKPEDVPQLVALINALNKHEGTAQTMTVQHAEFILFNPARAVRMRCRVATVSTKVIGFVLFYEGYDTATTSMGFHVADIFVADAYRGQSLGRMLMADVAVLCLAQGGEWCSLTALASNASAQTFYDVLGFHTPEVKFRSIGPKGLGILAAQGN